MESRHSRARSARSAPPSRSTRYSRRAPTPHAPMRRCPCQWTTDRCHGCTNMAGMQVTAPAMPGQDAFGAIAEVVRLLDADPETDWSKVDLERLRQHLIDMNEVVLRSDGEADARPRRPRNGHHGQRPHRAGDPRHGRPPRGGARSHAGVVGEDGTDRGRRPPDRRREASRMTPRPSRASVASASGDSSPRERTISRHHLAMAKGEALAGQGSPPPRRRPM